MPTLKYEEIETLQAFTGLFLARAKAVEKEKNILWYRGAGKYDYKLEPSLFRHSEKDIIELLKLEKKLMTRFHQRGYPFVQKPFPDNWERLFFMQHYGLPTRLLDWSESPYVALYFALDSAKRKDDGNYEDNVAVWILNPTKWNEFLYPRPSQNRDILTSLDKEQLDRYAPPDNPEVHSLLAPPVALYGTHNSQRIVSQRGVFIMFGSSTLPMEEQYENYLGLNVKSEPANFPPDLLLKIKIPALKIDALKKELSSHAKESWYLVPTCARIAVTLWQSVSKFW